MAVGTALLREEIKECPLILPFSNIALSNTLYIVLNWEGLLCRRHDRRQRKEKVSLLPDSKSGPESVPRCLNVGVNVSLGGPARTCSVARVVVREDIAV